ncbi:MAG: CRISPR system precrRNA processing endoribonuclease RAMP protein Cas6 [Deltaproteobacteria bacterium]|nr:CRISPR system precrRNA processing endoribonuclease RAMP protein Cas6 [Deltaproteobacteria bacterium]
MNQCFPKLQGVEFSRIHFTLEFSEEFSLSLESMLCMRTGLRNAGRHLARLECCIDSSGGQSPAELFEPPLPVDPVAVRLFQKPSPFFAFQPSNDLPLKISAGGLFEISATFWGKGIQQIGQFAQTLQGMGNSGFKGDRGYFELMEMESEDLSGNRFSIWSEGSHFNRLTPAVNSVNTWLEEHGHRDTSLGLRFLTPARLISQGKPLFQPSFARIFPFVLRRVTSMLYHSCYLELDIDFKQLIELAGQAREKTNRLVWEDCKAAGGRKELGGFVNEIEVEGDGLEKLSYFLDIGALMNIGKGAAYGAGCYQVVES